MTLIFPALFAVSVGVGASVVLLHLIATRDFAKDVLPTARFVPSLLRVSQKSMRRPADVLLLAIRVASVLLIGVGFARPQFRVRRAASFRIIIVDRSAAVANEEEVYDSVRSLIADGSVRDHALVWVDSTSHFSMGQSPSAAHQDPHANFPVHGTLSAALIAALHVASRVKDSADSLELVVVSAFSRAELDAATDSIRALWPASIRMVRVAERNDTPTRDDSVAIAWPPDGHAPGTTPRPRADTVDGVVAANIVVVAPFERRWQLDTSGARVIARWIDGVPAAIERSAPTGPRRCNRLIAIAVPSVGDIALRPEFQRLTSALRRPCSSEVHEESLAGQWTSDSGGKPTRVASRYILRASSFSSTGGVWCLLLAGILLGVETVVRRSIIEK